MRHELVLEGCNSRFDGFELSLNRQRKASPFLPASLLPLGISFLLSKLPPAPAICVSIDFVHPIRQSQHKHDALAIGLELNHGLIIIGGIGERFRAITG